jgi:hypothetical protein
MTYTHTELKRQEYGTRKIELIEPPCNVPGLASLGNVANVCVGSKVYNI